MSPRAMPAFLSSIPFLAAPQAKLSKQCSLSARPKMTITPEKHDSLASPRFRRDSDDPDTKTQTSFFQTPSSVPSDTSNQPPTIDSPNKRVLNQIRQTMDQLGVSQDSTKSSAPPPRRPVDISEASPLSALLGAAGAAFISYVAWHLLTGTVDFALTRPLDDQFYVVQRLAVVVRTTIVCIFALASGISGVTALGLALLSARTAYASITGEFTKSDSTSPPPDRQS